MIRGFASDLLEIDESRRNPVGDVDVHAMGLGDLAGRHSELVLYRQAVYGCRDQAVPQVPETTVETPAKLPA